MGIRSSGELIIDKCKCEFDPCCEVLDQKSPFQIKIFTNEVGKDT